MKATVYVIRDNKKIHREYNVETLSITYTGNDVPTVNISLPSRIAPFLMRKSALLIEAYGECILVEVIGCDLKIGSGIVDVTCSHIFNEWEHETIPVNIAKKKASVKSLMTNKDFVYQREKWDIKFDNSSEINEQFEYEFSRENKLEALDKSINMTTGLMKRIPRNSNRVLEIGVFGEKKQKFRIRHSGEKANLISVDMTMDGGNIKNMIVPLADKSDGGASSLTLRDLLKGNHKEVLEDFPIVDTGFLVNTQGTDIGYDFPQYAPNHKNEFAVIDKHGLELEDGEVYEDTFTANDLQPIQEDGKKITNEDRINATITLYRTVVRLCKNSRRQISFVLELNELPDDVDVLDKVKFSVAECVPDYGACMTEYEKNIYANDEWFYITEITMNLTDCGWTYTMTVSKDLAGILGNRIN